MKRPALLASGVAATLATTALWHQPLGAGDRFAASVEAQSRAQLERDEMTQVQAHLEHDPLTRRLILSGPADTFQREEVVRRMEALPGVGEARWATGPAPAAGTPLIPLLGEVELLSLASFCLGLLLAYLIELRRRSRRW